MSGIDTACMAPGHACFRGLLGIDGAVEGAVRVPGTAHKAPARIGSEAESSAAACRAGACLLQCLPFLSQGARVHGLMHACVHACATSFVRVRVVCFLIVCEPSELSMLPAKGSTCMHGCMHACVRSCVDGHVLYDSRFRQQLLHCREQ